jgi:hypothetical protein
MKIDKEISAVKYRVERDVFGRWIIIHPEHFHLAWSGSRWVPHYRGIGKIAQISNFDTQQAADDTARQQIA